MTYELLDLGHHEKSIKKREGSDDVATEMLNDRFEVGSRDTELLKLRNELKQFVKKMQSEGLLTSVTQIPIVTFESDTSFDKQ